MASIYTNTTSLQNAFHIEFNKPLDDRMSHESVKSFLINKSNPTACPLYKKAYVGMPVSVLNEERNAALLYVCKDATPYIFQGDGKPGAADVTALTIGNYWTLMSGGEYKLVKLSTANDGMLATYKMQYKAPGKDTFSDISGADSIDIPKDYLLKDVHLCKALYVGGKYIETSKQGESNWDTDNNDVYIHFIWFTKDGGSEKTSETYLKVSDVINVDVTEINEHIDSSIAKVYEHIDSSWDAINGHIDSSYVSLNSSVASHIDASVNAINTRIDSSLATLNSAIDASWVAINTHIDSSYLKINSSFVEVNQHVNSSINAVNSSINAVNSSINAINSSISEMDEVRAAAIIDLERRVAALEKASTSASVLAEHVEETEQIEQ